MLPIRRTCTLLAATTIAIGAGVLVAGPAAAHPGHERDSTQTREAIGTVTERLRAINEARVAAGEGPQSAPAGTTVDLEVVGEAKLPPVEVDRVTVHLTLAALDVHTGQDYREVHKQVRGILEQLAGERLTKLQGVNHAPHHGHDDSFSLVDWRQRKRFQLEAEVAFATIDDAFAFTESLVSSLGQLHAAMPGGPNQHHIATWRVLAYLDCCSASDEALIAAESQAWVDAVSRARTRAQMLRDAVAGGGVAIAHVGVVVPPKVDWPARSFSALSVASLEPGQFTARDARRAPMSDELVAAIGRGDRSYRAAVIEALAEQCSPTMKLTVPMQLVIGPGPKAAPEHHEDDHDRHEHGDHHHDHTH
ncbi:MAG: hypothetical protein AAGI30_03380 [Planctomycetota bacterium]